MSETQRYIKNYFKRFADPKPILEEPISQKTEIIVVIPCHNEPDLLGTLDSLIECYSPECGVEVIVVVNESEDGGEKKEVRIQNKQTLSDFHKWQKSKKGNDIDFHLIEALNLPRKHAGVGLARKVGMDEALRRFTRINKIGSIVCLDADCRVSKNYLKSIFEEFHQTDHGIGEMHYEHRYELESEFENYGKLKQGIINYELHLRYYVEGLKKAGFPNAIQTVGSCMLVKSDVYAKYGGMNKRKAGEDFYFLHKIVPHEKFTTVTKGIVFPSCRISDRVPFGTGKAQQDWLDKPSKGYFTYDPRTFDELKTLFDAVDEIFQNNASDISDKVKSFFEEYNYWNKLELIRRNSKTRLQFRKQFFVWFDGFMCMKFIHYCRDQFYPNVILEKAVFELFGSENQILESNSDNRSMLEWFRLQVSIEK